MNKDIEIEEMQTLQESEFEGLKNLLREKDKKLQEMSSEHQNVLKVMRSLLTLQTDVQSICYDQKQPQGVVFLI